MNSVGYVLGTLCPETLTSAICGELYSARAHMYVFGVLVFVCLTKLSLLSASDIGSNFSPWQ